MEVYCRLHEVVVISTWLATAKPSYQPITVRTVQRLRVHLQELWLRILVAPVTRFVIAHSFNDRGHYICIRRQRGREVNNRR